MVIAWVHEVCFEDVRGEMGSVVESHQLGVAVALDDLLDVVGIWCPHAGDLDSLSSRVVVLYSIRSHAAASQSGTSPPRFRISSVNVDPRFVKRRSWVAPNAAYSAHPQAVPKHTDDSVLACTVTSRRAALKIVNSGKQG